MALGVCLLFDERGDRRMRALWDRLEEQGIPTLLSHTHGGHAPHLSYAVLLRWRLEEVQDTVGALPTRPAFDLTFHAVATFRRGRSWLVPAVSLDLVSRQQRVYDALRGDGSAGSVMHDNYRPGRWVPHCSLAPRARLDQLPALAATVNDVLPLTVRVERAVLIESATGQRWPLPNLP